MGITILTFGKGVILDMFCFEHFCVNSFNKKKPPPPGVFPHGARGEVGE